MQFHATALLHRQETGTDSSTLTATAASASEIDLSWTNNASNQTGFQIQRSPDGSTWSNLATVGAGVTSYADTGLASATTYSYRVNAYNGAGSSAWSNTASASTTSSTSATGYTLTGPPTAPIGATSIPFVITPVATPVRQPDGSYLSAAPMTGTVTVALSGGLSGTITRTFSNSATP